MSGQRSKLVDYDRDGDPWEPGTVFYGSRNHWRVVSAAAVESRVWPWRWRYEVVPLGPHGGVIPDDALRVETYRPGEGPRDLFGDPDG